MANQCIASVEHDGTRPWMIRGSSWLDVPSVGGGMGIRDDEPMVESDCIRCVQCGYEFDTRLEMMET